MLEVFQHSISSASAISLSTSRVKPAASVPMDYGAGDGTIDPPIFPRKRPVKSYFADVVVSEQQSFLK
jgi:hypothetical protein